MDRLTVLRQEAEKLGCAGCVSSRLVEAADAAKGNRPDTASILRKIAKQWYEPCAVPDIQMRDEAAVARLQGAINDLKGAVDEAVRQRDEAVAVCDALLSWNGGKRSVAAAVSDIQALVDLTEVRSEYPNTREALLKGVEALETYYTNRPEPKPTTVLGPDAKPADWCDLCRFGSGPGGNEDCISGRRRDKSCKGEHTYWEPIPVTKPDPTPQQSRYHANCLHHKCPIGMDPCKSCFTEVGKPRWEPIPPEPKKPVCCECHDPLTTGDGIVCARCVEVKAEVVRIANLLAQLRRGDCVQHRDGRKGLVFVVGPVLSVRIYDPARGYTDATNWNVSDVVGKLELKKEN